MKLQLSISLLASDRPETLKKCLDSLTPILNRIPSELIVVFTGNDPEVERIIRQYTTQIVLFTWCDDFSAARNAGLEKASGEWFMYIDDDEWFDNTEEICEFFKSGEYKKYSSASYLIRNYVSDDGRNYIDVEAGRLVRRTDNVRFRYSIHEELFPMRTPTKRLQDFVHHYGYTVSQNEKAQRNIPLLEKELEKDRTNLKMYVQLAQEFWNIQKYKKVERYCEEALEVLRKKRQFDECGEWLFVFYPSSIWAQGEHERAWEEAEKILREDKPGELASAKLYSLLADTGMSLNRYREGLNYIEKYYRALCWMKKNPMLCREQAVLGLTYEEVAKEEQTLYVDGLEYAVKSEDEEAVGRILKWIAKDINESNREFYMENIDEWKARNKEQKEKILKCFSRVHSDDVYISFQKALYWEAVGEREKAEDLFLRCVRLQEPYLRSQLLEMAIRNCFEIASLIEDLSIYTWANTVYSIVQNTDLADYDTFAVKVEKSLVTYPLHYAVIQRFLLEKKMRFGNLEGKALTEVMEQYAKSVVGYYRCLYKEELFVEKMWFCLPDVCRFAMLAVNALECEKKEEYKECLAYLRRAIQAQPDMADVVKRLIEYIQQEIDNPQKIEDVKLRQQEFHILGQQIKRTVGELIDKKQYKEARPIVDQLLKLLPGDAEVLEMQQEILRGDREQ